MDKDYQMVTVYQYLDLLDKKATNNGEHLKKIVNRYMTDSNKADRNAVLLEKMVS